MKTSYYASRNSAVLIAYIFVEKFVTICITSITTAAIHLYMYVQVGRLLGKKYKKAFCKATTSTVCLVS